jgi:hypothetical protein
MEKAKVFIASSARTLTVAEKLQEQLRTEFSEATLWSEAGRRSPGATIIEVLENALDDSDFAVVVLAKDDVMTSDAGDTLKARDNCVFEAGMFVARLGRDRCFLVNSVEQHDLPSDVGGVISLPFVEPDDLVNREACGAAVKSVSSAIKDTIQRAGPATAQMRLPLLSTREVFQRERPYDQGGDLREGKVVVCDLEPLPSPESAVQVRRNLDCGTSYIFFLYLGHTFNLIDKLCRSLQIILTSNDAPTEPAPDFNTRLRVVQEEGERVVDDLRAICDVGSLRVSLIPADPQFCFRIHNASDRELARLYLRYRNRGYMLWTEGDTAVSIWQALPIYLETEDQSRIFLPMKNYELSADDKRRFHNALDRGLSRYFPGLEEEIRILCIGQ